MSNFITGVNKVILKFMSDFRKYILYTQWKILFIFPEKNSSKSRTLKLQCKNSKIYSFKLAHKRLYIKRKAYMIYKSERISTQAYILENKLQYVEGPIYYK